MRSFSGGSPRRRACAGSSTKRRSRTRGPSSSAGPEGESNSTSVVFRYREDRPPALQNVSLVVEAGETLALVGPSGAGKSTLVNLVPRFFDPATGAVRLDGIDIREATLESLRRQIAIVSQEIALFQDTIAANIAYGSLASATQNEIHQAAEAAHVNEFLDELPDGLDTIVGENGLDLSGGQRQRISLARAFLKDAPILILDEPTSALDSISEQRIRSALSTLRQDRTTIIIAHRPSTIEMADRIALMQEGRIVAAGTPLCSPRGQRALSQPEPPSGPGPGRVMGTTRTRADATPNFPSTCRDAAERNVPGGPFVLPRETSPSTDAKSRRIAIVVSSLSGGGVQRKALLIAAGLMRRGHSVDLVPLRPICDLPDEIPERCRVFFPSAGRVDNTGIPDNLEHATVRTVVPERMPWRVLAQRTARVASRHWKQLPYLVRTEFFGWAEGVAAYLERERPDAILAMHTRSVVATTIAIRLTGRQVRVVATMHNLPETTRGRRRIASFYPHADILVGISSDISAGLASMTSSPMGRVHTVYNPIVSPEVLKKADAPVDHPWLNAPDRPVVLAAGRLEEGKGFRILLSAFTMLLERRRARLIVLGQGSQLSVLQSLGKELQIREHVDFPGFVANPFPFMANANLFVLSSRREGLPTVLIEAMACGCPVVSTDCPDGPAEILEGGRLGELVPVGDSRALADAMERTLDAPPDAEVLRGRAGFFGVDPAVERYESLLLGRPPRRG